MYQKELETYLQHKIPRAVLLYGEWEFYIEYYANKIAKLTPQVQIYRVYFKDYCFEEVLEYISQDSLFGGGNLVWLKLDKKLAAKEVRILLDRLSKHLQNALIIEFYRAKSLSEYAQDFKQFAAQFKHPKLEVIEVRFFMPDLSTRLALLQEKTRALNLSVSMEALTLLLEVQNNDVRLIYQDLEKLALLDKPIGLSDIHTHVYGVGGIQLEELLAVLFKRSSKVLETFMRLLAEGFEEIELIRGLQRYFYQLFGFYAYMQKGSSNAKEILGYNPPQAITQTLKERCQQVMNYQQVFVYLNAWYVASMQGGNESWHFLIKIQDNIC
ncbi:DNA polymerase III subunit delta [Helicobacter suis]|uniref:DNA polymerase III subunit delta n=1 Tax=Helicobacter suis TaxID=104628 RepID=UPI0013D40294|nr:DNA polymerase III [Helicobacter suis]